MGIDGESELLSVAAKFQDRIDGFICSICPGIVLGTHCNKLLAFDHREEGGMQNSVHRPPLLNGP